MWYRSLYWRIALGFIGGLALLLVVQAMLFVWMMSAAGSAVPNQPPDRLAQAVAVDVAQALERDATLDIERYVRQEYAKDTQPFFVVLASSAVADGSPVERLTLLASRAVADDSPDEPHAAVPRPAVMSVSATVCFHVRVARAVGWLLIGSSL